MLREQLFSFINSSGFTSLLRRAKKDTVTVLSLHRVSEETDYFFDPIKPDIFEKLIQYCVKEYDIIPFRDLQKKTKKPKLIISFDDGYLDFMEHAVPILRKYCLPSNHNLVNVCLNSGEVIWTQKINYIFNFLRDNKITDDKYISLYGSTFQESNKNWKKYLNSFYRYLLSVDMLNKQNIIKDLVTAYGIQLAYKMMNWEDAKNCTDKYDVEIGSHTYNHETITSIDKSLYNLEIKDSITELELKLNKKIEIFAFPNGQYNEQSVEYCQSIGLKHLLLINDKVNPSQNINKDFNLINRVYLINESRNEAILRIELFHQNIRKFL